MGLTGARRPTRLAGAALVLADVMLVTLRPARARDAATAPAVETPGT